MAGKRLVMGPSPGTGLFVHEPKPRDRGRYGKEPETKVLDGPTLMVEQEEERVNSRLVDILERKCSKLRQRADEEEQQRIALEAEKELHVAELEELRRRVQERDQQVADLCAAQRDLAEDRRAAAKQVSALQASQQQCRELQHSLQACEAELHRQRQQNNSCDAEWKAQVVQLVAEARDAGARAAELEKELAFLRGENARLAAAAQDVVLRYEEESAQRLALEERCLSLEEKARVRDQRVRSDLEAAQEKARQSHQAKQKYEELSQQKEELGREVLSRATEAEQRSQGLESELQRLRCSWAERGRRIEDLEAQLKSQLVPSGPPPRAPRPDTAQSTGSAASGNSLLGPLQRAKGPPGANQVAPGAIRRAGSTPVRRQDSRGSSPTPQAASSSSLVQVATPKPVAVTRTPAPMSRTSSIPSRPSSALAQEPDIDDAIPSEKDSSDDEVLSPVKPVRNGRG